VWRALYEAKMGKRTVVATLQIVSCCLDLELKLLIAIHAMECGGGANYVRASATKLNMVAVSASKY
jgi:hypothetical protein